MNDEIPVTSVDPKDSDLVVPEVPPEVLERALWRFGPQDRIPEILRDKDLRPFDLGRLFWFRKDEIARGSAWDKVSAMSRKLGVVNEHAYKGWRKCHTDNFWAWYAYDVQAF